MKVSDIHFERAPGAIESTGERFVLDAAESETELEHVHRYLIAAGLCAGKTVLDAACGEGYGAALMAQAAARVVGVDIDAATLAAARHRYEKPNLEFQEADASALPFPDDSFDLITSFETLEHLPRQEEMVRGFRRVLKPEGVLLISTPDKTVYNRHLDAPNAFHVQELELDEFTALLQRSFPHVAIYGQRVVFGSLLTTSAAELPMVALRRDPGKGTISAAKAFETSMYYVAVCSAEPQPGLEASLYEGGVPQNAMTSLLGGIAERDARIAEGDARVAERDARIAERDARIAELSERSTSQLAEGELHRDGWMGWFHRGRASAVGASVEQALRVETFLPDYWPFSANLTISALGRSVVVAPRPGKHDFLLPVGGAAGEFTYTISADDVRSPAELGVGDDQRRLACIIVNVEVVG